ncbi:MAG: adenosylcobinamide-GDP ribazoletransferase [Rhodobacteraceae bacterium]|nr:adenosylcobinamide-GDP ribazoletransferase [Paracoccaceae bacterium]
MPKTDKTPFLWDIGVAFALLTRLPLPTLPKSAFANQARAVWVFGLVGLVVGAIGASAGWLAMHAGLPVMAAAGLVLLVQIIVTGAMHEDGLADTADGLWGGITPARRLEIMGDSRIGTYGVLALILSLGLRWVALAVVLTINPGLVTVTAALSRAFVPLVMSTLPFARADGLSRRVGRPGWWVSGGAALVVAVLAVMACGPSVITPIGLACLAVALLATISNAKIGGQTGDILGASQQVAEIALLLGFAAMA